MQWFYHVPINDEIFPAANADYRRSSSRRTTVYRIDPPYNE